MELDHGDPALGIVQYYQVQLGDFLAAGRGVLRAPGIALSWWNQGEGLDESGYWQIAELDVRDVKPFFLPLLVGFDQLSIEVTGSGLPW